MPVARLLVEGSLDAEVLGALLGGTPPVSAAGTKGSLAPQAIRDRKKKNAVETAYLRDRDFDTDPEDLGVPSVDRTFEGRALGWRWCRHEMENYLIDPVIVVPATGWDGDAYCEQLTKAACAIRHYQIARWVIGAARRHLPPHHELNTREPEIGELSLPTDITEDGTSRWARQQIAVFHDRIERCLAPAVVAGMHASYADRLTEPFLSSVDSALLWCSGKDLLAALGPWLVVRGEDNAGAFRARLRDWVRGHATEAMAAIPELARLVAILRA